MKLFDDYLPLDGTYDMRRDTTGLPKELANRINFNICFKGGGGGGTVVEGVPDEWKPQVTSLLDSLTGNVDKKLAGKEEIVAGMTPEQKEALAQQSNQAKAQMAGTGAYNMASANEAALRNTMGSMMGKSSAGGALGSARTQKAMGSALTNQSTEQQRARQKDISTGISELGKAGTAYQKQNQNVLDAEGNLVKGALGAVTGATGTQKTTTGGGGK